MKYFSGNFYFVIYLLVLWGITLYAQQWDSQLAGTPSVLFKDGTYHMWYVGNIPEPLGSIGYASSQDGIHWEKYAGNPILVAEPRDGWNEKTVYEPNVIFVDSLFHMWYSSSEDPQLENNIQIHHATSKDGLAWIKDTVNNPVLVKGTPGTWDDWFIDSHCIIKVDHVYHMWYMGWNGTANQVRIGHATSLDAVNWTKDQENNPVLSYGSPTSWDYPRVEGPNVIYDGSTFHMWYNGGNHSTWRVGYATSDDGITWSKNENNPVLKTGFAGSWDDQWVGFISVLWDSNSTTYKMWYSGSGDYLLNRDPWDVTGEIGYATSPDGIQWTKLDTPVVKRSTVTGLSDRIDAKIAGFELNQNYPNPFNPMTNFEFRISNIAHVNLSVCNLLGQKVATLVDKKQPAGSYQVQWNASGFASGIYLYRLQAGDFVQTRKLLLLK